VNLKAVFTNDAKTRRCCKPILLYHLTDLLVYQAVRRGEDQGLSLDVADTFSVRKSLTDALDPSKPAMNRQSADALAVDTSEYNLRNFIVDYVFAKFSALPGVRRDVIIASRVIRRRVVISACSPRSCFMQALDLTLYLMQFGSDQIIGDLRQQQWQLERLTKFQSSRGDTPDLDAGINQLSEKVGVRITFSVDHHH
jgi:hypothetical protein